MKQIYLVKPEGYGRGYSAAYIDRESAAIAAEVFGARADDIRAVPVLDFPLEDSDLCLDEWGGDGDAV